MTGLRPSGKAAVAVLLLGLSLLGLARDAEAGKRQAAVGARFEAPTAAFLPGAPLDVTLQLTAFEDAPDVVVELLPANGVRVIAGLAHWGGALARGAEIRLPFTVEIADAGEHTLGARVTGRRGGRVEVIGAVLSFRTGGGLGEARADPPDVLRLRSAAGPAELRGLGLLSESAPSRQARRGRVDPSAAAGERMVTGQIRWRDPEGGLHPFRLAYVEILDGDSRVLLAQTATDSTGVYLASVTAERIAVVAFSRDAEGKRVSVVAPDDLGLGFALESPAVTLGAPITVLDLTAAPTIRGRPGAPSADSLAGRAFAVYDVLVTFWMQAVATIGAEPAPARVVFPASTTSGCGTTCYLAATREIFILREDAFDGDVLGHEFFHFLADRAAARAIDRNPGGSHAGGSAIGMPPRPGAAPRNRDEGMRLAWSEGLATFMSLALQSRPPDPTFAFPMSAAPATDGRYQDTEDIEVALDAESPADSAGFGSPSSVLGLLWDLFDAGVDGPVEDTNQGVDAPFLWGLLTRTLPCDPCDRVDRVWTAATRLLGVTDPRTLAVARALAQNLIAPRAVLPASGARLSAAVPPAFTWVAHGDPSPAHGNDRFALALSRDGFRTHVALIDVPGLGATSHIPTGAEWAAALAGGVAGSRWDWLVVGLRHDEPAVPEGWYWYSNAVDFTLVD